MHRKELARILRIMAEEHINTADELSELATVIASENDSYEPARPPETVSQEELAEVAIPVSITYPYSDAMQGNPEAIKVFVRRDLARGEACRVEWQRTEWTIYLPGDEV